MDNNILHICNWYPTTDEPKRALWIRDQIDMTKSFSASEVWHVEVVYGSWPKLKTISMVDHRKLLLQFPTRTWFLIEILSGILVAYLLFGKIRIKSFSHIHFHIAYPLLTYWHWIGKFVRQPIVVSEHWSAYHFNFHIKNPKKRVRIQRIFSNPMHLITVSKALAHDIVQFSNNRTLDYSVIPNVVDFDTFYYKEETITPNTFFMVSQWKDPKDPVTVLEAIKMLPDLQLRIGGYGPQLETMKSWVAAHHMADRVTFLGTLDKADIASEMSCATAFIQSSYYETFSVVCAEAIACGCPVVASAVGGIPEFINDKNGVLVATQEVEDWKNAIIKMLNFETSRPTIAQQTFDRFDAVHSIIAMKNVY